MTVCYLENELLQSGCAVYSHASSPGNGTPILVGSKLAVAIKLANCVHSAVLSAEFYYMCVNVLS